MDDREQNARLLSCPTGLNVPWAHIDTFVLHLVQPLVAALAVYAY